MVGERASGLTLEEGIVEMGKVNLATRRLHLSSWRTVDYVLVVATAAVYGAAFLTLAHVKLVPGTNLRPANALQAVFGILFGIPGCLGVALGNVMNDVYIGAQALEMPVGALSNFLGAFIPFLLVSHPALETRRSFFQFYVGVVVLTSAVVSASIYVNALLGLLPPEVAMTLAIVIFFNQAIPTAVLSPVLLKLLYPFAKRLGLYRGKPVD
jgi:hypothetical protein